MRLDELLPIEEIGYKLHDMGNSTSGTTDKLEDFVDVDIGFVNLRTFSTLKGSCGRGLDTSSSKWSRGQGKLSKLCPHRECVDISFGGGEEERTRWQ